MINIFNRAVLFRDTNAEAAAKVWSTLKENGIEYEMKTKTGVDPMERQLKQTANMKFMNGGIPASTMNAGAKPFLYVIFVKKADLEKARQVCDL